MTIPMSWSWAIAAAPSSRGSTPIRSRCCSCAPIGASRVPASRSSRPNSARSCWTPSHSRRKGVISKVALALCCMSHSPLLNLPGPSQDLLDDVGAAIAQARAFVEDYDPELVVIFSPDHYNGFFYKVMPPFCIGMRANGVGDYGTHAGPLDVPEELAADCATAVLGAGVDVAVSASMDVDHGTVQPLEKLFGEATARPVIPIFVNAIGVPLGPLHRCRALGAAVGSYLATLGKRVLVIGSGGLSHSPPVPTLATAPPAVLERIVHGQPMTSEQRQVRQATVIDAARSFAAGESDLQPLNPAWDHRFLEIIDAGRLDDLDQWSNSFVLNEGGGSAHEIRTWVAAFAALESAGPYQTDMRYYKPAAELIAGFAIRTATPK